MDIKFQLFTVTTSVDKKPFSAPVGQIAGISPGRFENSGRIILSSGGHVDTVETYEDLVRMWGERTGTGAISTVPESWT